MESHARRYPDVKIEDSHRYGTGSSLDNSTLAAGLERVAQLMALEPELAYRVDTYREAAATVRRAPKPLWQVVEADGVEGVHALGIGYLLAGRLVDWINSGDFPLLRRLEQSHSPTEELEQVPGIGKKLARQLTALGIENVDQLRQAMKQGRLRGLCGFGPKRIELVQQILDHGRAHARHRDARQLDLGIDAG
ncbi:MAG: helix-hairpin-helix domain-containing protein [Myxococcaceae bacterium]